MEKRIEELEKKVQELEAALIESNQTTAKALETIGSNLESQIERVLKEYREGYMDAAFKFAEGKMKRIARLEIANHERKRDLLHSFEKQISFIETQYDTEDGKDTAVLEAFNKYRKRLANLDN